MVTDGNATERNTRTQVVVTFLDGFQDELQVTAYRLDLAGGLWVTIKYAAGRTEARVIPWGQIERVSVY